MNLIGVSINYKTASIEQREALHFDIDSIVKLIPDIKNELFEEGFILSK